jgi:hypothetical protein
MSVQVRACPVRWIAGSCAGIASTWLPATDLAAAIANPTAFGARELGSMDAAAERWLLVTVTLTRGGVLPGESAALRLQAWGASGQLAAAPGSLAMTGSGAGGWVPPALAFAAVGTGLVLASVARRREAVDD